MHQEKGHFKKSLLFPLLFVFLMTAMEIIEVVFDISLVKFGILPGNISGLIGIAASPLIHSDFEHLLSNSFPIIFLGTGLLYFYKNSAPKVIAMIYIIPGILVWLFGRESYHIGASGLVYGFAAFLFFSGIIRRDTRAITLALLVTFLYGSLVWGILPLERGISWEGHLFGALTGIAAAVIFRKSDPYKKYDWEDEEEDDIDPDELKISHHRGPPDF